MYSCGRHCRKRLPNFAVYNRETRFRYRTAISPFALQPVWDSIDVFCFDQKGKLRTFKACWLRLNPPASFLVAMLLTHGRLGLYWPLHRLSISVTASLKVLLAHANVFIGSLGPNMHWSCIIQSESFMSSALSDKTRLLASMLIHNLSLHRQPQMQSVSRRLFQQFLFFASSLIDEVCSSSSFLLLIPELVLSSVLLASICLLAHHPNSG